MNTSTHPAGPDDIEVGERVSEALIVKRVTVKALAEELGVSYSTMRRTLSGERSFTIRQIRHVARVLNIKPTAILPTEAAEDIAA